MSHTIELKKVSKYYAGEESVSMGCSKIDLSLDIGEFVVITGESGSGKSTLLNVISGLDSYDEGEMFVCGEDTTAFSIEDYEQYRKSYIGNIFQDYNIIGSYTVYQNIEIAMILSGMEPGKCRERVKELIHLVELDAYEKTRASKLSGGQKQRVAIARALAKDAPIIVADEPTGNLDSESAESVMKLLGTVATDKLVIVVTHNYEQAEPYATRKITMRDGHILEDCRLADNEEAPETDETAEEPELGRTVSDELSMKMGTKTGLGIRNAFNIASKFILLFVLYLFVSSAVLTQYASIRSNMHEKELLGISKYFINTDANRVVVTKKDKSAFTDHDIAVLNNVENVDRVIRNDIAIDKGCVFDADNIKIKGPVYPVSEISSKDLTYGSLPAGDDELIIKTSPSSDSYINIVDYGEDLIGTTVELKDMLTGKAALLDRKLTVAGIIIDKDASQSDTSSKLGYSSIYVTSSVEEDVTAAMMSAVSECTADFGGTKVDVDTAELVAPSEKVEAGEAYLLEDAAAFYDESKAEGKSVGIAISNKYFSSNADLKVKKVVTHDNCATELEISKKTYDSGVASIYISKEDYDKLFKHGSYQVSLFLEDELDYEETIEDISGRGYSGFAVKEALIDVTGSSDYLTELMGYGRMLAELIVLFLIAYAVISLVMKSRKGYYATLRILGATKSDTSAILKVELVFMMMLAYLVDIAAVLLINYKVIRIPYAAELINFLSVADYVFLAVVIVLMSLLIAGRYSKKLFSDSAMRIFRGEAG